MNNGPPVRYGFVSIVLILLVAGVLLGMAVYRNIALMEEIQQLQRANKELAEGYTALQQAKDSIEQQLAQREAELEELRQRYAKLQAEYNALRDQAQQEAQGSTQSSSPNALEVPARSGQEAWWMAQIDTYIVPAVAAAIVFLAVALGARLLRQPTPPAPGARPPKQAPPQPARRSPGRLIKARLVPNRSEDGNALGGYDGGEQAPQPEGARA